jgi:NAD(P) transhydrogenase subunit alpha
MIISALLEKALETRVAITPHTAKIYLDMGFEVCIEKDAGLQSGFSNEAYAAVGVQCIKRAALLKRTNLLLAVDEPQLDDLNALSPGAFVIAPLDKNTDSPLVQCALKKPLHLFSMNLIPRISRAQNMDSLSSQANLAGYRAVIEALQHFSRVCPMMMTAAGMIQPAKVLILGAGVAGLQAIATAKRLGAIVYAFDVRHAAKEQVESLGAEFIEIAAEKNNETEGGYAKEVSEAYKKLQQALIDDYAKQVDLIISTALIPGQPSPTLLYRHTIEQMKPGSVIVDLATARGGNCELSVKDKTIRHGSITIIGNAHLERLIPATASDLFANNLRHLVSFLFPKGQLDPFNPDDEILTQALLSSEGRYLPFHKNTQGVG